MVRDLHLSSKELGGLFSPWQQILGVGEGRAEEEVVMASAAPLTHMQLGGIVPLDPLLAQRSCLV